MKDQRTPRPRHRDRGMTLIEILVVIAIIVILVGLLVAGGVGAFAATDVKRTRTAVNITRATVDEYFAQVGQYPQYEGISTPKQDSIWVLIDTVSKLPEAKKILMAVEKEFRLDDDDNDGASDLGDGDTQPNVIVDAWGEPLQYRHYHDGGLAYTGGGNMNAHGTGGSPQPFVASSGPDKIFGTADDIYSYELE